MDVNSVDAWRTPSVEDFLRTVYLLQQDVERVSTGSLADMLQIAPASVTDMVKRLAGVKQNENGLVIPEPLLEYKRYYGVRLTECGTRIALNVIRRHRLIELYLCTVLGYSWDEVHEEADRLEHAVSDKFVTRIAVALDHPERDPHGDPIPNAQGVLPVSELKALPTLPLQQPVLITRILDQSAESLRQLTALDLKPGRVVRLVENSEAHDTLTLLLDEGAEITISQRVAEGILARRTTAFDIDPLPAGD
jgi:DtxR family Mn-dependent transcriptional regulator